MNPLGGYFELELHKGTEYHQKAIRINTGRNAFELILRSRKYSKVYIPYFTCEVILEPFLKLNINYEFYSIDKNFEPIFNYTLIKPDEGFLYNNYFGLKDNFITDLSSYCRNLIIDNSQSFYSNPLIGIDTFYSARKFFGVPDGAYLYLDDVDFANLPFDISIDRFTHLIERIDLGAEAGYNGFKKNEQKLIGQPIMHMSKLTNMILCNIDYLLIKKKRKENFLFLHKQISIYNKLDLILNKNSIPMVYPFLHDKMNIKQILIKNKIFTASYWPNVLEWTNINSIEYKYASEIIYLPIDQRYSKQDMNFIVKLIKNI